ncbi:12652_t:CDS:1, partial [Cetraspora pellucida]
QLDTCNNCLKKRIKKFSNFANINENNSDASEILNQFDYQNKNSDLENNEDDCVLYKLTKLKKLVVMHFANLEKNHKVFKN